MYILEKYALFTFRDGLTRSSILASDKQITPAEGPGGGPPTPPWATAGAAVVPGGEGGKGVGGDRLGWGHVGILYKAPRDYTMPRQTIHSPSKLYKSPTDNTNTLSMRRNPNILNKDITYLA